MTPFFSQGENLGWYMKMGGICNGKGGVEIEATASTDGRDTTRRAFHFMLLLGLSQEVAKKET